MSKVFIYSKAIREKKRQQKRESLLEEWDANIKSRLEKFHLDFEKYLTRATIDDLEYIRFRVNYLEKLKSRCNSITDRVRDKYLDYLMELEYELWRYNHTK